MVSFGLESGCPEMLRRMGKRQHPSDVVQAAWAARSVGLSVRCTVSIGNPGESVDSILATAKVVREIRPSQVGAYLVKLYPGTPLYISARKQRFISDDYWFDRSNEIIPYYTEGHSLDFMKVLQSLLRTELEPKAVSVQESPGNNLHLEFSW